MATFSTNQVRQLYVAKKVDETYTGSSQTWAPVSRDPGTIDLKTDDKKSHMYFNYIGAGGQVRSDLINIKDIISVKATDASSMERKLKQVTVTLDSNINSGSPVAGQDYLLRVSISRAFGTSDEDLYYKFGTVHAFAGMTASDFYRELALSLAKNFSRELVPFVTIALKTSASSEEVTAYTKKADLDDTYTGVIITEAEQEWVLGIKSQVPVLFDVYPDSIRVDGDEVIWGVVELTDSKKVINNGKNIADLEYFCMGERGDIYRNVGWPNVIPTKYLVDPTKAYCTLDIHYAYVGPNEGPQKSEKDITIVADDKSVLNQIITALNDATGLTIATL